MAKVFKADVPATSVLLMDQVGTVYVSRTATFPNCVDLSIRRTANYVCAHLSLHEARELILALALAVDVELSVE